MTNSKIIVKPFERGAETDKSRHITGLHKWASNSRLIGTFMLILGWFTIPFEVFFRRDFGQRWFTAVNFLMGFILLMAVGGIQYIYTAVVEHVHEIISYRHLFSSPSPDTDMEAVRVEMINVLFWMALAYVFMGSYHLFKIKWRNQENLAIHSYDDGTSCLRWPAFALMWFLNANAIPFMAIYYLFIPKKQRKGKTWPKLIANWEAFTDVFFEPVIIFTCACLCSQFVSFWLFLSSFALFIHAYWKEMARKNKLLDFQDGKFAAEVMRDIREDKKTKKIQREKFIESLFIPQQVTPSFTGYPKLSVIIDEWQSTMQGQKGQAPSQSAFQQANPNPASATTNANSNWIDNLKDWAKRTFKF